MTAEKRKQISVTSNTEVLLAIEKAREIWPTDLVNRGDGVVLRKIVVHWSLSQSENGRGAALRELKAKIDDMSGEIRSMRAQVEHFDLVLESVANGAPVEHAGCM